VKGEKKRENRTVLTNDAKYWKIRRRNKKGNGNVVLLQK
jgi:hypothetical protein